jgi:hypothetical protein
MRARSGTWDSVSIVLAKGAPEITEPKAPNSPGRKPTNLRTTSKGKEDSPKVGSMSSKREGKDPKTATAKIKANEKKEPKKIEKSVYEL